MLDFLRRHQRYFFVIITIVIVISFSFFGSYGAIDTSYPHDQIVFKTLDGSQIKRLELDEMTQFISSDAQDKQIMGGIWGPNFLNDGVISKNFLETGMGIILASNYKEELLKDLQPRLEKEKRYSLYKNPQAGFVGVESAWSYFAPQMKHQFDNLRSGDNPVDSEMLAARMSLFLQEKQFPAPLLRQILQYQENQSSWLPKDPNLVYQDLALFGYHTIEDWFGPRFVRLIAQFIINSAKVAEQKGYRVSKEEVMADLMNNAEKSYEQNINNPNLGVANLQQYFDEQLRRMNLDRNKAVQIWKNVLLFRRLFNDVGNAVVVDPFSIEKLENYSKEGVIGKLYELPADFRFNSYQDLQKFETYLKAVAVNYDGKTLNLPEKFLTVQEVAKKHPELIQHRYVLEIAKVSKKSLQTKVSVKETWDYEIADKNFEVLKSKFPVLAVKKATNADERLKALDSLDDKTRAIVDSFARNAIVDLHPEWIEEALEKAPLKSQDIAILEKGGKIHFAGDKRDEIISLLDSATLKGEEENDAASKLKKYQGDDNTFYRIIVVKRNPQKEIVTFKEALSQGVLDTLLEKDLEAHYLSVRDKDSSQFKKADGSWKDLKDVRDIIADQYFTNINQAIKNDYIKAIAPQKAPSVFLGDYLATLRFYSHMRKIRDEIAKDVNLEDKYILKNSDINDFDGKTALKDQWKLVVSPYELSRSDNSQFLNLNELISLKEKEYSKVFTPANGDVNFFQVEEKGVVAKKEAEKKVQSVYQVASTDAMRNYMQKLLYQLKENKALSLDYLNKALD